MTLGTPSGASGGPIPGGDAAHVPIDAEVAGATKAKLDEVTAMVHKMTLERREMVTSVISIPTRRGGICVELCRFWRRSINGGYPMLPFEGNLFHKKSPYAEGKVLRSPSQLPLRKLCNSMLGDSATTPFSRITPSPFFKQRPRINPLLLQKS